MEEDELLTVQQVADELQMHRASVWKNIDAKRLSATRYGKVFLIRRSALREFVATKPKRRGRHPKPRQSP